MYRKRRDANTYRRRSLTISEIEGEMLLSHINGLQSLLYILLSGGSKKNGVEELTMLCIFKEYIGSSSEQDALCKLKFKNKLSENNNLQIIG